MNNVQINVAEHCGTDLSSRARAAFLRGDICDLLDRGEADRVVLEFQTVRTLSESFADELFAVIVAERGEDYFQTHIAVQNLSRDQLRTILESVRRRTAESQPA